MFDDEEQLEYCMGVAEEAKELLDQKLEGKRKQAKKEVKSRLAVRVRQNTSQQFFLSPGRVFQSVPSQYETLVMCAGTGLSGDPA